MNHLGTTPVIAISLKFDAISYEKLLENISYLLQEIYIKHQYLLKSQSIRSVHKEKFKKYYNGTLNEVDIEKGLQFLSELLHKHFNKTSIILFDEYDH